jgi:hypothetical protein
MPRKKREPSKAMVTKAMLKRLNIERIQLGATRDNLRMIAEEANELADNTEEALESLGSTIETLSKYV